MVAAGVLVAGCGSGTAGPPRTPPRPNSGPLLTITEGGGLAPVMMPYAPPSVVVYGDGRVVESERYQPMRARVATLRRAAVDRIAARARGLGLAQGRRIRGDPHMADGMSLTLTFVSGRNRATTMVGAGGGGSLRAFAGGLALARLPHGDLQAPPKPYASGSVAVVTDSAPDPPHTARAWPLAAPQNVPALGRTACRTYGGGSAKKAARMLGKVDMMRYWRAGGKVVRLIAYPLLPYERGCADLARR